MWSLKHKVWILILAGLLGIIGIYLGIKTASPTVVYVITASTGRDLDGYRYYSVNSRGKVKKIREFISDEIERYDALFDSPSYRLSGHGEHDAVKQELLNTARKVESGETVRPTETIDAIKAAARGNIKHDIFQFDILQDGETYFAVFQLNVNWQSPCVLYRWLPETRTLERLCSWDSAEIVGIALP